MSDPVNNLLSRLDKVRERKPDTWVACCPAHGDRNPSLSITRGDDGRVLLRCWAGCTALDVVQTLGMTLADLFEQPDYHAKPSRKRLYPNYRHILELVKHELTVLMIGAEKIHKNEKLTEQEYRTVSRAYVNISKILEVANV